MNFLKKTAIVAIGLILIAGMIGIYLPKDFSVSRSISINASNKAIHFYLDDLDQWQQWSTWQLDDPTIVIFKGRTSMGVGASQSWQGNSGEGKLEITSSSIENGIEYDLYFDGGEQKSLATMLYRRDGNNTIVTWSMTGSMDIAILGGYFNLLIDGMIGTMFERGLLRLKQLVEKNNSN